MQHIDSTVTGSVIVALAIFAHAWHTRIVAPPALLSVIGWVINALAAAALAACWIRG